MRRSSRTLVRLGDIERIDAALGYRFTNYLQGKVQDSVSRQAPAQEGEHLVAFQITAKF